MVVTRHRWAAWFAGLALLLQAWAPFAQAVARDFSPDIEYQFICTVDGIKQIPVDGKEVPSGTSGGVSCPFCLTYASPALVQPAAQPLVQAVSATSELISPPFHQDVQSNLWRGGPNPSRAPPQHG